MDINAIHGPIIIFSLIGVVVWCVYIVRSKSRWLYAIPPLTYLINAFAFFILASEEMLSKYTYNIWGDAVQLHAVILMVLIGMVFILAGNPWTRQH